MHQERSRNSLKAFPMSMTIADGINWGYRCAALCEMCLHDATPQQPIKGIYSFDCVCSCSPSTYTHYAEQDGVHAMFSGEISEWPGIDMMSEQHDGVFS